MVYRCDTQWTALVMSQVKARITVEILELKKIMADLVSASGGDEPVAKRQKK